MKKNKVGIQEFLIWHMVLVALITSGLMLSIWIINEYSFFLSESKLLQKDYLNSEKAKLRTEVNNVVDYINYMKSQTENRLKSELQGRVYEAIAIAENIYGQNAAVKSPDEIKKMSKDALRPIRFLNGRGYYFAFSMDGIEMLFADRPEMEGVNMLPVQGAEGEYVVRDMIDIVKKRQEGFYQYTWTKPGIAGKNFLKIAFVKYFPSFDWAIGTGEYLADFTGQVQDSVLERIVGLKFRDEGYFFGSVAGGYPLFTDGKITRKTPRIWDMTDPNGVKIIQEQQNVSRNPEGGFVQYMWPKPGLRDPVPKISFVREIPDWGWTIGAGIYLDTIEKIIAKNEIALKKKLVNKLIASICVFIGLIVLIWLWAKHVGGQTRKNIKTFESFLTKAAREFVTIPAEDMQFRELSRIADSANKMIEAQKRSETALRDSESRHRRLFETMAQGIVYQTADGRIISVNPAAERILGLSLRQMQDKTSDAPFWDAVFEDGAPLPGREHPSMVTLRTGRPVTSFIMGVRNQQTGARVWLDVSTIPLCHPGETKPFQAYAVFSDITERKQAGEELRRRENLLQRIFEILPIGLWFADKDGALLRGNPMGVKIWGAEPKVPISEYGIFKAWRLPSREPVEPGDWALAKTIRDGVTIVDELLEIESFDGKKKTILNYTAPVFDDGGNVDGAIVVNLDISDRKALEAQLAQAQKMESVGRLAGGVAHDFNNMLGVILGYSELALTQIYPGQPLFHSLQEIRRAAERSANLTRQLLAFARKQTVTPKVLDLNDTVEGMLQMLRRLIGEDIDLRWLPGAKLWPVKIDPGQIDQILANLCINARDAIAGTGRLTIETGTRVFDDACCMESPDFLPGEYVLLAVSDDGSGMDGKTLDNIFEPFFTTKGVGKGTGLGLATVYGIVKQNNGFIKVYSEEGQGTTFKIHFPRHESDTEQLRLKDPAAPVAKGSETILLVEDEPTILDMTQMMLKRYGYKVLAASSPDEAIRLAKDHAGKIHLLMTDVIMPEMNGRNLAKNLSALFPALKCLFMSGYTADVIARHGVLDKGVQFIQKPFSIKDLAVSVRKALDTPED